MFFSQASSGMSVMPLMLAHQLCVCYKRHMPRIIFAASESEKELWVQAAHREYISLSEWLRRAAAARAGNDGLAAGGTGVDEADPGTRGVRQRGTAVPAPTPPAASSSEVTPDFKRGK